VPVVPSGAVLESGSRPVVFVETAPGRFEMRTVTVGARAGDLIRVTGGLQPGERVVVDGGMLLLGSAKRTTS
jgi:multidrug efflux pump subunit AcrA (membrane-fusion protein)